MLDCMLVQTTLYSFCNINLYKMKKQFSCTALFQYNAKDGNWDQIIIKASDVAMPPETYEGVTRPKTYWPVHTNYAQACKLVSGMTYLATFTLTPEPGQPHDKLSLSDIDPIKSKIEQRQLAAELKSAQ